MNADEQAIRQLVATWMSATQTGDVATVLSLISEDAVFLIAGRPEPMRKPEFAAAMRAMAQRPGIEGHNDIQEVQVAGDMAFAWTRLRVTVAPHEGQPGGERKGFALTVFRKEADGRWRLARDANLMQ